MTERDRSWAAARLVAALILGYVGIYLCRKNLSVAVPLLQRDLGASREQIGWISSISTLAYTMGKMAGPAVDRLGGRLGFLAALGGVALFGAAGAFVPGLLALLVVYSLNRFFGAMGWGAMMKLVPTWYESRRLATVVGVLSLSYVGGGIAATLLAREVVTAGGGWRAVMGFPSLVLAAILLLCFFVVRAGPLDACATATDAPRRPPPSVMKLLRNPQFLIVCVMSFAITLLRETFNTWGVDFLATLETGKGAVAAAALKSTPFDLAGGVSIFLMGILYDRVPLPLRRFLLAGILLLLAFVLLALHPLVRANPAHGALWVGLVGLLVYGPYSLLAGVFAVESGGPELAATAAGIVDAVGYVAGAMAGALLGRLLDAGGYQLGFRCLAGVTVVAALLALGKKPNRPAPDR